MNENKRETFRSLPLSFFDFEYTPGHAAFRGVVKVQRADKVFFSDFRLFVKK